MIKKELKSITLLILSTLIAALLLTGCSVSSNDGSSSSVSSKSWVCETLDSTGDVGYNTSIALDSNGYAYISYFDSTNYDLKYVVYK
jgi:hypothetical protein